MRKSRDGALGKGWDLVVPALCVAAFIAVPIIVMVLVNWR